jgi:cation:H+ antiporter
MLVALGLLAVGALVLYVGAEAAVRGAGGLARAAGIRPFVLGALLFGIDVEGLGATVAAAARGETSLAAGTVVGTVLFLYGVAFGAALLVSRGPVLAPQPLLVLTPALHLVAGGFTLADRYVARIEGVFLLVMYLAYAGLLLRLRKTPAAVAQNDPEPAGATRSVTALAAVALGGLALLVIGGTVAVDGATRFGEVTGLAAGFVGASVIGVLVSLDEVLLEVLAVRRGTPELATGNLFGTLPAFVAGVLGLAALIQPLDVDSATAAGYLAVAFLYAVVATVFLLRGRAGRGLGGFVLLCYGGWLAVASTL